MSINPEFDQQLPDSPAPRRKFYIVGLAFGQAAIAFALYGANFLSMLSGKSTKGGEDAFWGSAVIWILMPIATFVVSLVTFIIGRRSGTSRPAFIALAVVQVIGFFFIRRLLLND